MSYIIKCKGCNHKFTEKKLKEINDNKQLQDAGLSNICPYCGESDFQKEYY